MIRRKATILIVEDEHDIRVLLRQMLEIDGYSVVSSANGQGALKLLENGPMPAVILLDMRMPLMNGDELLKILQGNPLLRGIPVIVITADLDVSQPSARCILYKPMDPAQLLLEVEKCLAA